MSLFSLNCTASCPPNRVSCVATGAASALPPPTPVAASLLNEGMADKFPLFP